MGCGCAKAGVLKRSSNATINESSENLIVYEVNKVRLSLDQIKNKKVDVVERCNNLDVSAGGKLLAPITLNKRMSLTPRLPYGTPCVNAK
jgi:hypothetical protein